MASNAAYLDELVAEYLTYRGFFVSLKAFKQDQKSDKSKSFNIDKIVDFLMQLISSGDLQLLRMTWSHLVSTVFSRLPDTLHMASAQRVEIALYKLYLVQAFQNGKKEKIAEFFQTMSSSLIANSDNSAWKDWLAFPYVNQPSTQAPFAVCFTRPWQDSVTISLTNLLMIAFNALPKPRLVLLMEHIAKLESDLLRIRESAGSSGKESKESLESMDRGTSSVAESLPVASDSRPSRRLLSFFTSNKTSSPASNQIGSGASFNLPSSDFRRTKSQSSFPRQQPVPQPQFVPGAFNRISDLPTPENPGETDYNNSNNNRLRVESETEDTVVITNKTKNSKPSSTSDVSTVEGAFEGHTGATDNDSGNEESDQHQQGQGDDDSLATPKATGSEHGGSEHSSPPLPSSVEKLLDSLPALGELNNLNNNKRNSLQHRKQASTTKFTCLDIERVEVPGCHGTALVRYSPDGRFLGVLSQSAQAVFIFSADSVGSRGIVTSALVSSPPSCFCIGSSSQHSSGDDLTQLLVVVGSSTTGRIYVFCHTDSSLHTSKMTMTSSQLLLVPLEPGLVTKQHSVQSIDVVPNQSDVAVVVVSITDNHTPSSKTISSSSSHIYVVSLVDLIVMRRIDSDFSSPISCLCCLPASPLSQPTGKSPPSWLLAVGDTSGSIFASQFTSAITWQSLKLLLFGKIINIQPLSDGKLLACDSTGRFAVCRVDADISSSSLTITPLSECDGFCSAEVTSWPSPSPDGQFAAVLFDRGASLFLVNISSPDFGDIVAQLPGNSGKDTASGGNSERKNSLKDALDFASVAWTPSVLQTAFTYVAALTNAGDLLVFRLLT